MKKSNYKIPGNLLPPPKSEVDGKILNISSKSVPELVELRDRQLKLLNNRVFVSKLLDKGEKIQLFLNKINKELKSKLEEEQTCKLLSNMNLNKESIDDIEWKCKLNTTKDSYLDSDDDSEPENVLNILSQTTSNERKIKIKTPDKPLITTEDLVDTDEIPHVKYIMNITETENKTRAGQFKPYKTTKTDVHEPGKEILRKKHKNWEVTAATPPPIVHSPVKILSLQESLALQKEYNIHIKEVEAKHAAEKLFARSGIKMSELPLVTSFGNYREVDSDQSTSDDEGSNKEVHDEEPERGGVIFTVTN